MIVSQVRRQSIPARSASEGNSGCKPALALRAGVLARNLRNGQLALFTFRAGPWAARNVNGRGGQQRQRRLVGRMCRSPQQSVREVGRRSLSLRDGLRRLWATRAVGVPG